MMLGGESVVHDDSAKTLETGIQARPGITVEMSTQIDEFKKKRSFPEKTVLTGNSTFSLGQ